MTRDRKPSVQTIKLLSALALRPTDWLYGLELSRMTGLKSGSLYPILIRLADRGLLDSQWLEPAEPSRPARHAYRISASGLTALADAPLANAPRFRESMA